MKTLKQNSYGFSVIELFLVIVVLAVVGTAGYFVSKRGTSISSKQFTFPTGQLTYSLPDGWTRAVIPDDGIGGGSGFETTKQTKDYGYA